MMKNDGENEGRKMDMSKMKGMDKKMEKKEIKTTIIFFLTQ
jgi:hypothetical protein